MNKQRKCVCSLSDITYMQILKYSINYIYILFGHKREWNLAISDNMNGLKGITLHEISQKKKTTKWSHLYGKSKSKQTKGGC